MSSALGTMHIVCPHCTTSYAVNPATFGDAGRTVRCARCKEVWHATPEDLSRPLQVASAGAAEPDDDDLSAWGVSEDEIRAPEVPVVDSPSISADWPPEPAFTRKAAMAAEDADWDAPVERPVPATARGCRFGRLGRLVPAFPRLAGIARHALPIATAAMAAAVMALMVWRVDIVKLMPQTAAFYDMVGLSVNVRGLAFRDVKVSTEMVEGKPVMVIEGLIVSETRTPTAMPRLRFVVRDDKGHEIYAWSAVLEQPGLNPGDKAWFRSRLASPPADGRSIDVRFFNKRDLAA